jgi:hypothetical protein
MLKNTSLALVVGASSLLSTPSARAAAPEFGTVVEGQSVPGVALGFTRAEVEVAYGPPESCTDQTVYGSDLRGLDAICDFTVIGGGQTTIYYRDVDGSLAKGSPDDVVYFVRWSEAVGGWTTTAGVNTTLAKEDPEAAAAAYPNAEVTRNQWGGITRIKDYPLGIEILRSPNFYAGTVSVTMAIFVPGSAPPTPEELTRVTDIELTAKKAKGRRQIRALVKVEKESTLAAAGATVLATWEYPDGSTLPVVDVTSMSGYAYFEILRAARGSYTLRIDDVVLDGRRFDLENSLLEASVTVK